ncbi:hypothetical protein N0V93_003331 [Gnomoniopsis smithogilvyi]|uniref:Uncharacterized protein n=1 Tax=Gnomoniopsis smithogilvyi TaxID=1191159 RepID=A0A9W8YWG7_9PEZI|nr:hypothetical protein N0V93_003331 [Gnomoniopsis smithogilvyi]
MLGYKQCGSSIADVSDKNLPSQHFTGLEGGLFQEGGLVHPPCRGGDSLPGQPIFRPREIRGTPAPVFIAEPRNHRVNGLFTNDSRGFQQIRAQPTAPAPRLPPVRDLLRSDSQKRPSIANFPPHQGQPSSFNFSRLRSTKGAQGYEMQSLTPLGQIQQQDVRALQNDPYGLVSPSSPLSVFPSSRQRGVTVESDDSFNQSLVESPFLRLIPLEEARKNAASRRAGGRTEDAVPILAAHGAAAQHAIRNISNTSNAGSTITAPAAVATTPISRFAPRAIANHKKKAMDTQDSTRPTISTIDDSGQLIHTFTYPDGSRSYMFDPESRLVPWDQRHRRGLAPQSTDRSLQHIQHGQRGLRGTGRVRFSNNSSERWISRDADEKRRTFFLYTAFLSIFPFISIIALCGGFNDALSWSTHGEVHRFSKRQMNFLMLEAIVGLITWVSITVFVVLKIR